MKISNTRYPKPISLSLCWAWWHFLRARKETGRLECILALPHACVIVQTACCHFFFFLSTALQSDNIYNKVYVLKQKYTLVSLRVILILAWFSGYNDFELSPHWPATAVAWPRTLEIVSNNPVGVCLAWTFILNKAANIWIITDKVQGLESLP